MDFPTKNSLVSRYLNVCRCCLKEDGFTDTSTYLDSPEMETCGEVLKSTFDIQLWPKPADSVCLICEPCVRALRDARAFKQMVLRSVETLSKYLQTLHCPDEDLNLPLQEYKEPIKLEEFDEVINNDCQEYSDDSPDDNEMLANLKLNNSSSDETAAVKRKHERKSKSKRCKIKEHNQMVSNAPREKDWGKISERRGTGPLLRDNSLKLIQNSSLCVFQWNKSQYRCFCCNLPFTDINSLKEHTYKQHTIENIEKKIILQQNRLVKVEISDLECRLCREKLEDITILKEHLRIHSILVSEDLLVPFRIEPVLKCQICFEKFSMFRLLNIHINKHFQKQVCHICGAGFSNLVFLNLHKTRSHRSFDCKICDLTFSNRTDKKHHDMSTHGVKHERKLRFPCPYCPERFFQENFKVKHLVEKHGLTKPEFKCSVCPKTFITRSLCNNHVKNVHNKERNQECDVCHTFFYTKSDVARHRVTHTGEKKYSCEMCSNPFATRDSLRRHMKRTHVGVN